MVESEEALDAEMAAAEDFLIQLSAKFLKIFQAFCHRSSGGTLSWQPASYYELTRATSAERGRGARFLHRLRLRRSSCCDGHGLRPLVFCIFRVDVAVKHNRVRGSSVCALCLRAQGSAEHERQRLENESKGVTF